MSSLALGLYFKPIKFACSDSSILLKCTHNKPTSLAGAGTTFNFISVIKAKVPSEPAIKLQKLKLGPPAVKGSASTKISIA